MANKLEKHIQTVLVSLITAGILWIGFSLTKLGADVSVIQAAVSRLESKIQMVEQDHYIIQDIQERLKRVESKVK